MKLLAPNGKPSKLTPEQYRLVRTSAFKNWFGDWENDAENSSKVIDENGEPLVVYHGTSKDFYIFGEGKNKDILEEYQEQYNFKKKVNYFHTNKEYAETFGSKYGGYEKPFFLDIKKIEVVEENEIEDIGYWKNIYDYYVILRNLDGINSKSGQYATLLNPHQIKLADGTNTTFDANNPDMRYAYGGDLKIHFDTLEEYQKWISDKIQEQGKEVFIKSEEYRVAYPRYRKLWNEKHNYIPQKRVIKNKIGFIAMAYDKNSNVSNDLHDPIEEKFTSFTQGKIRAKELAKTIFKKYKKIDHIIFDFLPLDEYGGISYGKNNPSPITYNRDYTRFDNGGTLTMKKPTLLAPNGKPSKLTPEQYRLVRTPEFKAWFGNWINSPETASKMVDYNGEPLVFYRGNAEQLGYEFTLGHNLLKKPTVNDFGHFFTPDKWVAQRYAEDFMQTKKGYILEVFLNAKNILNLTKLGSKSYGEEFVKHLKDSGISFLGFEDLISEVQEFNYTKDFDGSNIDANVYDFFDNFSRLRELFIKNNISGIKFYENSRGGGLTYVVFDSNQIKLADGTNTKFDANNPDVRYAKGGIINNFKYEIGGL